MSESHSTIRMCEFPGCDKKHDAKGLCHSHYSQKWKGKNLKPLHEKWRKRGTPPRVQYCEVPCLVPELDGPCHEWIRFKTKDGYGRISVNGKDILVHRYVWEQVNGPIPEGLFVDHKCRNRACCNVNHLRVVTKKINAIENSDSPTAINAKKTHCKNGHEFNEKNTYRTKNGRHCIVCQRNNVRRWRKRKAAKTKKGVFQ